VTGLRHIEILEYLPDSTRVPGADSSSVCGAYRTRTIGLKGRIRNTERVSLYAEARMNLKQESPERDLFYET
jgi:hypothetical protein